jgi:hypothetical protein
MRRVLLATAVSGAAFAGLLTQAVADRGPPVNVTITQMTPEESHFVLSGRVVASKPCRRSRDFEVRTEGPGRPGAVQGTLRPSNKAGHFGPGQVNWRYVRDGKPGDIPEGGGTLVVTLKAPKTRPQKGRFHSYHCKPIVRTERVEIPPDPFPEEP